MLVGTKSFQILTLAKTLFGHRVLGTGVIYQMLAAPLIVIILCMYQCYSQDIKEGLAQCSGSMVGRW